MDHKNEKQNYEAIISREKSKQMQHFYIKNRKSIGVKDEGEN